MEIIIIFIAGLCVGAAGGAWGYRYLLKRRPEAIERLAAQARELGRKISD